MVPVMVTAVFLATAPVVYFTLREHRQLHSERKEAVLDRATVFPRTVRVVGSTSERAAS